MSLLSAAVLLFFVMDPPGNVPLFLAALRHVDPVRVGLMPSVWLRQSPQLGH